MERSADISWKNVDFSVKRLRSRIFKAAKNGNYTSLRRLQRLMLRSFSNVLYSTRRVTKGRFTPGVDEHVVTIATDKMSLAPQYEFERMAALTCIESLHSKT